MGYLYAIGAVIFWGVDTVIIRWLISQDVNPFLIGDLRLLIGAGVLASAAIAASRFQKKTLPRVKYSKFFWIITLSLAANFLLFHFGLKFTIASDAVLLEAFAPVMVIILTMLFLPNRIKHLLKIPNLPQAILMLVIIGSIGSSMVMINYPKDLAANNIKLIGDLIEFIAMFAWALVMIGMHEYQRREKENNIIAVTSQFLFFAGVIVAFFVPWGELSHITATQWTLIALLGMFSTGCAYLLWHMASKRLDILPLATIFNLVSIFTVITESIALNVEISWKLVVGGALILYAAMKAKLINSKYKLLSPDAGGESPQTLSE